VLLRLGLGHELILARSGRRGDRCPRACPLARLPSAIGCGRGAIRGGQVARFRTHLALGISRVRSRGLEPGRSGSPRWFVPILSRLGLARRQALVEPGVLDREERAALRIEANRRGRVRNGPRSSLTCAARFSASRPRPLLRSAIAEELQPRRRSSATSNMLRQPDASMHHATTVGGREPAASWIRRTTHAARVTETPPDPVRYVV